jgi:hypothetical protein
MNAGFPALSFSSSAWGDYNNDGVPDIWIMGFDGTWFSGKIYSFVFQNPNTPPTAPSGLHLTNVGDYTYFGWNAAADAQTPVSGLSYALRIGTTPGGCEFSTPMTNSSGHKYVPASGYANSTCTWRIKTSTLPGQFYWSVQAIDKEYAGSPFAIEQHYSFPPKLAVLTPQPVIFDNTQTGSYGGWKAVRIQNTDVGNITINSLHLLSASGQYMLNYANLVNPLPPGAVDTIFVRFAPTSVGTKVDSLVIVSFSNHSETTKVALTGLSTPLAAPRPPDNLTLTLVGRNMQLDWSAVTRDVNNSIMIPDGYLVFYNASMTNQDDDYYYLWETPATTFTHYRVAQFSPRMAYRVIAYKDNGRGNLERLAGLNGTPQKLRLSDLGLE